jgi:hypothetical protein
MNRPPEYAGDAGEDIKSGRPQEYLDYIETAYGPAFRSGTNEAAETFYLLYQQFQALGNEQSTELFLSRFLPLLPQATRRRILNEVMENPQRPRRND